MPVDADLLAEAKAAEARVIEAEHTAEVARADFHRTVRRLQLAGASLREIAGALGLSHQRVHQIVAAAGGSRRWRSRRGDPADSRRCSFCGRPAQQVKTLISGPGVHICNRCVPLADQVAGTGGPVTTIDTVLAPVAPGDAAERCSFCGKRRHQVPALVSAGRARICPECLGLCHEMLDERLA
ncbi:MAG TPA: ClpX C4-type zinc finger protein [Streptosporangiaceae bacterium]